MQNEVDLRAIEIYAEALAETAETNTAVVQQMLTILQNSDCSPDFLVAVMYMLRRYETNSQSLMRVLDKEKNRQKTFMQKMISKFI